MKVIVKGGMKQKDNVAGIVNIENWEGTTMVISEELLQKATNVLRVLREVDFDTENVRIGISKGSKTPAGMFCVFLDTQKTVAYAVAGKLEEE